MDRYLYSVPGEDLKEKVKILNKELHKTFADHCDLLKTKNLEYDTYDSTLLYNKDLQLHLQSLYYYFVLKKINEK